MRRDPNRIYPLLFKLGAVWSLPQYQDCRLYQLLDALHGSDKMDPFYVEDAVWEARLYSILLQLKNGNSHD